MLDVDEQYRSMTDDELLNVAKDSQDLTPEARNSLNGELSRRRISSGEVSEYKNSQSDDTKDNKFNPEAAYSLWPTLRWIHETVRDWKQYRHQTGEWPLRSIAFYFSHLAVEFVVLLIIFWFGAHHGWSKGLFIIVLILLFTADTFLSNWLQKKIRLSEITRHRHPRGL